MEESCCCFADHGWLKPLPQPRWGGRAPLYWQRGKLFLIFFFFKFSFIIFLKIFSSLILGLNAPQVPVVWTGVK